MGPDRDRGLAIVFAAGCEEETGEWLEPTLAHATPSPFIAIIDAMSSTM